MPTAPALAVPIVMESELTDSRQNRWFGRLWLGFVVACCAFAAMHLSRMNISASLSALPEAAPGALVIAAALVVLSSLLRSARLAVLIKRGLFQIYPTQLVSSFLGSVTPGNVGEIAKIAFLGRLHQVPAPRATSALVIERAAEAVVLLLLAIPILHVVLPALTYQHTALVSGLLLTLGIGTIFCRANFRVPGRLVERFQYRLRLAVRACLQSRPSRLAIVCSGKLSLSVWILESTVLWFCLSALAVDTDFLTVLHALPAAVLLGTLSGLPAGAGVFDLSLVGMLALIAGVGETNAISAVLLFRAISAGFPAVVAICLMPVVTRRKPLFTFIQPAPKAKFTQF